MTVKTVYNAITINSILVKCRILMSALLVKSSFASFFERYCVNTQLNTVGKRPFSNEYFNSIIIC